MDVLVDVWATKDAVIRTDVSIFQCIYHAPGTTLATIRSDTTCSHERQQLGYIIKSDSLPPIEGAAAQHSLYAYL